jgi:hemerythrin-like domain-containing protein
MEARKTLMLEHRIIERTMDAFERWALETVSSGDPTEKDELDRFLLFIREFVDACHHAKEENILFDAMVDHGFSRQQGPLAVMLAEHEAGRRLVGMLDECARTRDPWTGSERQKILDTVQTFVALLRQHIQKEDKILYPMAEKRLPSAAQGEIDARFDRFEIEETGAGQHERLHELAEALIAKYGTARDSAPVEAHAAHRA